MQFLRGAPIGMTIFCFIFNFFEGMRMGDVEFGDGGAAESFEMGSAAETLAHFMSDGAHVGSGGHACAKVGAIGFDGGDEEFFYLDRHGLQDHFFLFSRQFVGRNAFDFLGREWGRHLLDHAEEFGGDFLETLKSESDRADFT
jgi:hypothetical protein